MENWKKDRLFGLVVGSIFVSAVWSMCTFGMYVDLKSKITTMKKELTKDVKIISILNSYIKGWDDGYSKCSEYWTYVLIMNISNTSKFNTLESKRCSTPG